MFGALKKIRVLLKLLEKEIEYRTKIEDMRAKTFMFFFYGKIDGVICKDGNSSVNIQLLIVNITFIYKMASLDTVESVYRNILLILTFYIAICK